MGDGQTLPLTSTTADLPEQPPGPPEDWPLPDRLRAALGDEYDLGPQIGQGGMGIVFRATDTRLKREVAIKVLPPEASHRADVRRRFVREAQMAASLTHPHIVPIYDVGQRGRLAWIVMAYIHGESARDLVKRAGPQPVHVVARALREVAWALSYAHARGLVHRDIKPDNIMLDRASGRAIVMDFGLAKLDDDGDESLTQPGRILGTPAYMSPEQARGKDEIDHRSDIYSLGLVGYFMLSARNPFDANNAQAVLARVVTENAPRAQAARPDAPIWLADAIDRATERSPSKRFAKAEELAEALDRGQSPKEPPTSVQYLIFWCEAYIELSTLAAIFLWVTGIPALKTGSALILACLLSLPLLLALQLFNAEGLAWADIRDGITAWRANSLRRLSLKHASGTSTATVAAIAITVVGVFAARWIGPLMNRYYSFHTSDWSNWLSLDDTGPAGDGKYLFQGPRGAFLYAVFGSIVWAKMFGLPRARRLSPQQLDRVASWRLPKALDYLGSILFMRIGASEKAIEATAELRQLYEPAVKEALAFKRAARKLPLRKRGCNLRAIHFGNLVVRRVWGIHERLGRWRDYLMNREPGTPAHDALAGKIAERENILAECAAALDSLRVSLEEAASPRPDEEPLDSHVIDELKRLTIRMRQTRWIGAGFVVGWLGLLATEILLAVVFKEQAWTALRVIGNVLVYSLPLYVLFMIFRRRLYT